MRYRPITPAVWFPVLSLLLLGITFWPRSGEVTENPKEVTVHTAADSGPARVLCVIGVQTGFTRAGASSQYDYVLRRVALRSSWFPNSRVALKNLYQRRGVIVSFIIGHSKNAADEAALAAEENEFGGFLRLPIEEGYTSLPSKTVSFLKVATRLYTPEYVVKIDDDVYLRIESLVLATQQWKERNAEYIGCMKNGDVYSDPKMRWFERQWPLLGKTYFTHAWGTLYVLSGSVAAQLSTVPDGLLRFFGNEDVTIGAWMLAFNVTHFDDRRLCETSCSASSIGVYDMPQCAGLCDPILSLPLLHGSASCKDSGKATLPMLQPYFSFVV